VTPPCFVAHEFGHRIQHVANRKVSSADDPRADIPSENMADCIAGAYVAWSYRHGRLDMREGDDLTDAFNGMLSAGEDEHEGRSHGTIDQRIRAFFVGYNSNPGRGLFDCDWYWTDDDGTSIVPTRFDDIDGNDVPPPTFPTRRTTTS
jgi:predicted metalloprotease